MRAGPRALPRLRNPAGWRPEYALQWVSIPIRRQPLELYPEQRGVFLLRP